MSAYTHHSQSNKTWRIFTASLVAILFLIRGKLHAPPPASVGHSISSTATGGR